MTNPITNFIDLANVTLGVTDRVQDAHVGVTQSE
jgi:hypothetical protein